MKTIKYILFLLEFPEMVIGLFFIAISTIGLSRALSEVGIDPRPVQIAGIMLMIILAVKLALKFFAFLGSGSGSQNQD